MRLLIRFLLWLSIAALPLQGGAAAFEHHAGAPCAAMQMHMQTQKQVDGAATSPKASSHANRGHCKGSTTSTTHSTCNACPGCGAVGLGPSRALPPIFAECVPASRPFA